MIYGKQIVIGWIADHLEEKHNIASRMERKGSGGWALYVDAKDYEKAIEFGSLYAINEDRYEMNWADANDMLYPVGYIPIMYGVLPQTVKGDVSWTSENCLEACPEDSSEDFKAYIDDLRTFCAVNQILARYDEKNNAFTLLASAPFMAHDLIVKRCQGFSYVCGFTPFIEVYYPSKDNTLDVDFGEVAKRRVDDLQSYFYQSLFHDIVRGPEDAHIAPHNDDYAHHMGMYGGDSYLEVIEAQVLPEDKLLVQGNFELHDTKGIEGSKEYCVVTDKGDFTSELSLSENEVAMTTNIHVARNISGTDLDGQNRRDAFFTCLSGDGSEGVITYTEHFVKIANGTRLLHYSDEYEAFEIYDLPNNWFVENGLAIDTIGYPKVFDDTTFDHNDKDLKEVYAILDARKKKLAAKRERTKGEDGSA